MLKKQSTYFLSLVALMIPTMASAAQTICSSNKDLGCVIDTIIKYLNQVLVLMMGVAVVMFVFYIIKYYIIADANRADGGKYVMFSLIGFFVILSFWGLVNILQNTFGLKNENNQPYSWTSFKGLFPGGSTYQGGGTNNNWSVPDVDNFDARGQEP